MIIYDILDQLKIQYKKFEHEAVFTCEDSKKFKLDLPGQDTKNLFLRNKNKSQYYLVVVDHNKRVNLNELRKVLDESKLSFGSAEALDETMGLTPGSVCIFGLINDQDRKLKVIFDQDIWESEHFLWHPLINTATLQINKLDLLKFLEHTGHHYVSEKIPCL